jgi:hypothetical protein
MYPLLPPPTLIVDTWGFRLADPDGNLIGRVSSLTVTDGTGVIMPVEPSPGIERSVQALGEN